ncbi:MAG: hypothetical protein DYG89_38235 [Caldilinea sp. CFX5]|nr:hypothetical protein [Caldilinea sp. CFX5]
MDHEPKLPADNLIALRVGTAQWLTDVGFQELLHFLATHPQTIDEVLFFTAFTHPPLPLAEMERRCMRLAELLPQVRAAGYRVGINVLASMGHHEENLPHSLAAPWPRVTDPEGKVSQGSYCPADPDLLAYVQRVYTLVAQAGPDLIWVDDDVRLYGHMPVVATCFCDGCMARFNREFGSAFTRTTLVAAMQGEPSAERDRWRDCWLEHNRRLVTTLLRTAAEAAHQVNPQIVMGFMTGDRFYEGYAFAEWAAALAGPMAGPARWRPGGGFYNDDAYMGLVEKAHDVGRQVSQLPATVTILQSEIENFPYQKLRKSVAITMLEAAAHMAAGATGPAFNIIGTNDALAEYLPFLAAIKAGKPFLHALRASTGRSPAVGVWPAWNRDLFANHGATGNWLRQNESVAALRRTYVLGELGLPIAYGPQGACMSVLSGPLPAAFSPAALEQIFAGGVLMDVAALQSLTQMGLGAWSGVRVAETFAHDMSEVLSDHSLNGRFSGWSRDCRQSFWPEPAYHLAALSAGVEELAHLVDYAGAAYGSCMTAFRNGLGGRVVVAGYYPWQLIHNLSKSSQLKAVCQWLSNDTLPVVVESYARVVVWARRDNQGRLVLVLLNASLDPAPVITLRVRTHSRQVQQLTMTGEEQTLTAQVTGPDHVAVTLHNVAPWTIHLLRWD